MRLHENIALFQDAISATAQQMRIPEIYVEKDYWVTFPLYSIFKSEIGKETVFKGGTALAKCHEFIFRFSEDVDLVVLRSTEETSNQLKKKIKRISNCIPKELPEIDIDGITRKRGMIRKTAHGYPKLFSGHFGQVRDIIVIEATWLGNFEPYTSERVSSFIYRMMHEGDQQQLIDEYEMSPFEVLTLSPQRTLCEKIMSLIRFSYSEDPINDLRNKIRHTYDIHLLLKEIPLKNFFLSKEFDKLLLNVAEDDIKSFKSSNLWLANHPKAALIFAETTTVWSKIKAVYTDSFYELVFGDFPAESEIETTLLDVSDRLQELEWDIAFPFS